jgi:hypothetical protein
MGGKTARGKKMMDEWLMINPGKKALIIDSKTGKTETRTFIPNIQLKEGDKDNGS